MCLASVIVKCNIILWNCVVLSMQAKKRFETFILWQNTKTIWFGINHLRSELSVYKRLHFPPSTIKCNYRSVVLFYFILFIWWITVFHSPSIQYWFFDLFVLHASNGLLVCSIFSLSLSSHKMPSNRSACCCKLLSRLSRCSVFTLRKLSISVKKVK